MSYSSDTYSVYQMHASFHLKFKEYGLIKYEWESQMMFILKTF